MYYALSRPLISVCKSALQEETHRYKKQIDYGKDWKDVKITTTKYIPSVLEYFQSYFQLKFKTSQKQRKRDHTNLSIRGE